MQIFLGILVSLIIGYMWMRFVDRAFSHRKLKLSFTSKMFFHGFILVSLLFAYQYVLTHLGWENQYFFNSFNPKTIMLFVIYCVVLIVILTLLYHNTRKKSMFRLIIVGSLLFLGVSLGGYFLGINVIIMYYILSAYAEEYLKFGTSNNIFLGESVDRRSSTTDLILFSILMGLGFSGIENLFFVGQNIISSLQSGVEISMGVLSTGRGLVTTLLHVVSTGVIAYIILYFNLKQKELNTNKKSSFAVKYFPKFVAIIVAILTGVGLHAIYNLTLYYNLKYLLIPLVVMCYFVLSFLLFKSDRMYDRG